MPEAQSSLIRTLELARAVELKTADVYAALAQRFQGESEARALFTLLREEELSHARRIEEFGAKLREDQQSLATVPAQIATVRLGLLTADDVRRRVVTAPMELEEAFDAATHLEEALFSSMHAEELARQSGSVLAPIFEEQAEYDLGHATLLKRQKYGLPSERCVTCGHY
jgi:rubrerythrin